MNTSTPLPPFTPASHINKLLAALLVMQEEGLVFSRSALPSPYRVAEALVQVRDELFASGQVEKEAIKIALQTYALPEEADFLQAAEQTLTTMAVKGVLMSKSALTEQLLSLLKEGHQQEELPPPDIVSGRLSIESRDSQTNPVLHFFSILFFLLGIVGLLTILPVLAFRYF